MGRFDFDGARAVFENLVAAHPGDLDIRTNLAIAVLNRQEEGDEATAKEILDGVLAEDPGHVRARYIRGLLFLHAGVSQSAFDDFRQVAREDPEDAAAAYHTGQALMQLEQFGEALTWFQRAIEGDSYLRSAHYRAFQACQRLGRAEEAEFHLARFQDLEGNPRARLMEFKYTKMGPWAEVAVIGEPLIEPGPRPKGSLFAPAERMTGGTVVATRPGTQTVPNVTACDIDGDGGPDFLVTAAATAGAGSDNLILFSGSTGYSPDQNHPLAAVEGVNAALWGDVDNDGLNDVYLCRSGRNQLWMQTSPGEWVRAAETAGAAGGDLNTVDGALFDADHDGDLDIFVVNADGDNELFNNNRDGTFRPLAAENGLGGAGRDSRAVIPADFDGDLVIDLMVVNSEPPHEVYMNRLLWDYQPAAGWDDFTAAAITMAVAGDADADGRVEVYTIDGDGRLDCWTDDGAGTWTPRALSSVSLDGDAPVGVELSDVDGDGVIDLLVALPGGWSVVSTVDGEVMESGDEVFASGGLFVLDPRRGPSLIGWSMDGGLVARHPGDGRHDFVTLDFSGLDDEANSMRTNASGIGTRAAARVGSRWTVVNTLRNQFGAGQSRQPLAIGLGGAERLDFVAIDWSDAVFQTEMGLESGVIHPIVETQRQMSSCPVLFVWDGERFAFVSDLLGVGGMGYAVGPGEYSEPRPWENLMLPSGVVAPRNGRIAVKLTEPMEEAAYFDAVRMVAFDVPPGWSMSIDDRMAILGPRPTGRAVLYRKFAEPVRAYNERGEDVTEAVAAVDRRAAPVGELDHRFIGRLADEHVLTLEFDEALNWLGRRLVLVADGWVEYPYSSTSFAAWQAGAAYEAPTLEARGADGRWTVVLEQFGYPAGMPRQISVPLPRLPTGTTAIRLRSNQEVFWDHVRVVGAEVTEEIVRRDLRLVSARVEQVGFALRTTGPDRLPHYDHDRRVPFWDTRVQPGVYTRFGDATELLTVADDALAIIGPGEGVHLEFETLPDEPDAGWTRVYVLEAEGWCKDMDLYTENGGTLGPIPAAGRASSTTAMLNESHNTRWNGS
jgi:Flp pilus assembly protein TadD